MFKINLKNKKGFTLLEALVAVSILMVAVSAPITIAQKGLSSAVYSKDQMVASYLAQDAIEYIKNVRDEVSINNDDFDWEGLSRFGGADSCLNNNLCDIDTITGEIRVFSVSTPLSMDDNNFFGHEGTRETRFTRSVNIKISEDNNDEALVTVAVKWGDNNPGVEVKTLIYNY